MPEPSGKERIVLKLSKRPNPLENFDPHEPIIHPFDNPQLQELVSKTFPHLTESLQTATRPGVSKNPDDLENWEAASILARKLPRPYEDYGDVGYLLRVLYEESFSVNQTPGLEYPNLFKSSAGLTPGGLLSHFSYHGTYDGHSLESTLPLAIGPDLQTSLTALETYDQRRQLYDMTVQCTYPDWNSHPAFKPSYRESATIPEDMETYGYRLLKMLNVEPAMLAPLPDSDLTAADKLDRTWRNASRTLLTNGFYNTPGSPDFNSNLEHLLKLRTDPAMQVFYKYLSPSGYINDHK